MKYVKVFTNFKRSMEGLSDAEKGRLFDAMLEYAETGEEPNLPGNERFVWGSVLNMFDAMNRFNEKQRANGLKGGRPAKFNETQINPENPNKPNESQKSLKEKKRKEKKYIEKESKEREPETAFEIALEEFRQHRKLMKKPLNELAERKLMNELERLSGGNEAIKIKIIDQSIRNGWQGVFPLKADRYTDYEQRPVSEHSLDHLLTNLDEV